MSPPSPSEPGSFNSETGRNNGCWLTLRALSKNEVTLLAIYKARLPIVKATKKDNAELDLHRNLDDAIIINSKISLTVKIELVCMIIKTQYKYVQYSMVSYILISAYMHNVNKVNLASVLRWFVYRDSTEWLIKVDFVIKKKYTLPKKPTTIKQKNKAEAKLSAVLFYFFLKKKSKHKKG